MDVSGDKRVFLITGIMAAGKSTTAELLAKRFAKGVHVRGDVFRRMIVSGRQEMEPGASEEALDQLELRYRLAATVVDAYFQAGFNVIVQDVILGESLARFAEYIKSKPLHVVVLAPSEEAVADREAGRVKKGYGEWTVSMLNDLLHRETPRMGFWLDSTGLTPEQTVDEIVRYGEREEGRRYGR